MIVTPPLMALARGWVADQGSVDHPVTDEEGNNQPKPAITGYRCIRRVELPIMVDRYPTSRYSLVRIKPKTGRRHQIRKHFKHISHHLIGDTTHGNGKHNRFFRIKFGIYRLLLLAHHLDFYHPYSGEEIRLKTEPEEEWQRLFNAFKWNPVIVDQ